MSRGGIDTWPAVLALVTVMTASCGGKTIDTGHTGDGPGGLAGYDSGAGGSPSLGAGGAPTLPTGPRCIETPSKLASDSPSDIAVNATDLYYALDDQSTPPNRGLMRLPLRGGQPTFVASIAGQENGIVLTATSVVFASSFPVDGGFAGEIVRVPLTGGSATVLASTRTALFGLASDEGNVYFSSSDGTKTVPLAGGAVRILTSHWGSLALVGSNLIIADSAGGSIFSLPINGGALTALATNQPGASLPVACGADTCWMNIAGSPSNPFAAIVRLSPGGTPAPIAQGPLTLYYPDKLLFDGADFFVAAIPDVSAGVISRTPAAGGSPVGIATGTGLAVDDECLYLGGPCGIFSVTKSYTSPQFAGSFESPADGPCTP